MPDETERAALTGRGARRGGGADARSGLCATPELHGRRVGGSKQEGEEEKSSSDGGSARLQCRCFTVLGTDYREGRQSRARQLWLKRKDNK